jgi:osmotically-inducible protein OsmY
MSHDEVTHDIAAGATSWYKRCVESKDRGTDTEVFYAVLQGHTTIQGENAMKTDMGLQSDVLAALAWEPRVDAAGIGVSVESGVVVLNGRVRSFPEKWAAESATQRVKGVKAVTDEIVVTLPGDSERSDADIAIAAVNALDWNASVPPNRIQILVEKAWITLEGSVEYHYQKTEAERAVRDLRGVRGVTNRISIKPSVSVENVKSQIEKALERAAEMDAQKIVVETHGDRVVLRGNVKSWAEREQAEHAAWSAPGVADVRNRITVCH